jgi:hypothetical protein
MWSFNININFLIINFININPCSHIMRHRWLILFFLIYLSAICTCFSQSKADSLYKEHILDEYNDFLKHAKLDSLLKATDFSFQKNYTLYNYPNQIKLKSVNVLTLQPAAGFDSQEKFIDAWNGMLTKFKNKDAIYSLLFLNLGVVTAKPPESLLIRIWGDTGDVYSFSVYYDQKIIVTKPALTAVGYNGVSNLPFFLAPAKPAEKTNRVPKGSAVLRAPRPHPGMKIIPKRRSWIGVNLGPGDLNNSLYGGFFSQAPISGRLKERLTAAITAFLKNGGKNGGTVLTPQMYGAGIVTFTAKNFGRVTPDYYEIIMVQLTIDPTTDQNKADVSFLFSVVFSSSPVDLDKYYQYGNAIADYPIRVSNYGASLKTVIHDVIYGKSN